MKKHLKLLASALIGIFCVVGASCGGLGGETSSSEIPANSSVAEVNKFTVNFDVEGIAAQEVEEGSIATEPTAPTKPGYVFDGWTLNGEAFDFETAITENITLVASWKAAADTAYTVEVYVEQADGSFAKYAADNWSEAKKGTTDTTVDGTDPLQLQQWGCDLSKFPGMQFDSDNENAVTSGVIAADGSLVIKLYVEFIRYDVTFTATNATISTLGETVAYGNKVTAPTVTPNEGYEFKGWYNGETEYDFETAVTADINLTAKIEAIPYTITYTTTDENGYSGTHSNTLESYTIESETITFANATSDNYDFLGWYNADGVKVEKIEQGSMGNVVLTAKWAPRMGVNNVWTYDVNNITAEGTIDSKEVTEIHDRTALKYVNGTWSAWTFVDVPFSAGLDIDAGDVLEFEYLICKNAGSHGASTYNLRFMTKGAEVLLGETMYTDNVPQNTWNSVTWTVTEKLVNAGGIRFYFEIVDANGSCGYDAYITNMTVTKSTIKDTPAEILAEQGITAKTVTVKDSEGNVVTAETLEVGTYTLEGIYTDNGVDKTFFLKTQVSNMVYTITYTTTDENGYSGTNPNTIDSYTIKSETIILEDATSDNYDFLGWYNADGVKVEKIEQGSTGNIEVTAKWAPRMGVNNVWTYDVNNITAEGTIDSKGVTEIQGRTALKYVNGTWSMWTFVDVPFSAGLNIKAGDTLSFEYLICKNAGSHGASTYNLRFMTKGAQTLLGDSLYADNVPQNTWNSVTWTVTEKLVNAGGIRFYFEIVDANGSCGYDAYITNMTVTKSTIKDTPAEILAEQGITAKTVTVKDSEGNVVTAETLEVNNTYTLEGIYTENGVDKTFVLKVKVNNMVYNITYILTDPNTGFGGNNNPNTVETYTIESETITLENATSDDYDFVGWFNADGVKVDKIEQGSTGDVELTAKWAPRMGVSSIWTYDVDKITVASGNINSKEVTNMQGRTALKIVNGTWSKWTYVDVPFSAGLDIDAGDLVEFEYLICKNDGSEGGSTYNTRFFAMGTTKFISGFPYADNVAQNTWNSISFTADEAFVTAGGIRIYFEIANVTEFCGFDAYFTNVTVTKSTMMTKLADVVTDTLGVTATTATATPTEGETITDLNATLTIGTVYTIEGLYVENGVTKVYKVSVKAYDGYNIDFENIKATNLSKVAGWNEWDVMQIQNGALYYCKAGAYSTIGFQAPESWLELINPETDKISFDLLVPAGKTFNIRFRTNTGMTEGGAFLAYVDGVTGTGKYETIVCSVSKQVAAMQTLKDNKGIMNLLLEQAGSNPLVAGQDKCYIDNIRIIKG